MPTAAIAFPVDTGKISVFLGLLTPGAGDVGTAAAMLKSYTAGARGASAATVMRCGDHRPSTLPTPLKAGRGLEGRIAATVLDAHVVQRRVAVVDVQLREVRT